MWGLTYFFHGRKTSNLESCTCVSPPLPESAAAPASSTHATHAVVCVHHPSRRLRRHQALAIITIITTSRAIQECIPSPVTTVPADPAPLLHRAGRLRHRTCTEVAERRARMNFYLQRRQERARAAGDRPTPSRTLATPASTSNGPACPAITREPHTQRLYIDILIPPRDKPWSVCSG